MGVGCEDRVKEGRSGRFMAGNRMQPVTNYYNVRIKKNLDLVLCRLVLTVLGVVFLHFVEDVVPSIL